MRSLIIAVAVGALVLTGCTTADGQRPGFTSGIQASIPAVPTLATAPPTSINPPPASPSGMVMMPSMGPAMTAMSSAGAGSGASAPPSAVVAGVPGTSAAPRFVDLTADDTLTFYPNVVQAIQGETVTFRIHNTGRATHEFMLGPVKDALADLEGTPEVADILAGQTASLTFTFTDAGAYAFACHAPGHFEAGMLGYVMVSGPGKATAGTPTSPRLIEVSMTDKLAFVPDQISVAKGETVIFLVTNEGSATHEFALGPADKVDADEIDGITVIEVDEIVAHHLKTVTYTFSGPGPYAFACHEPGHFEAGMRGTIELIGP